jgi:hypothetical protein
VTDETDEVGRAALGVTRRVVAVAVTTWDSASGAAGVAGWGTFAADRRLLVSADVTDPRADAAVPLAFVVW